MTHLSAEQCVACRRDSPRASAADVTALQPRIPQWSLTEHAGVLRLERAFTFHDWAQALAFTNALGALAEAQGHHPAITTEWGRVTVAWWTHAIAGLHRNDFIMAAKTDALYGG